jgi:putative membrane protein
LLKASEHAAAEAHLRLPTSLNASMRSLYDGLSKKRGKTFDTAYLDAMVKGHEAAAREFSREAATGKDPAIKRYAQEALPTIDAHLTLARMSLQEQKPGVAERQRP